MNTNAVLHYIVAVSIGSMMEPTAIAILEQEARTRDGYDVFNHALRLRHLERVPLDMRYPDMVDRVDSLVGQLEDQEQSKETDLIVDVTGTGRSVGNLMVQSGLKPIRITITGGVGEDEYEHRNWKLAKTELVGGLQVTFQSDRLEMASGLELVPTFVKELQGFKMRPPIINANDPESWREGQFDDLVFAVGLANWRAGKQIPRAARVVEIFPRQAPSASGWMA
jgi:hypothetical protein